jgi:3-hydroxybutyryl-CoA dehydrogenase
LIKKVAIIGLGSVGKSLTLTLAQQKYSVVAVTRRGEKGFEDLSNFIEKALERYGVDQNKCEILSRITCVPDFCKESQDVELVIEAVKENLIEKQQLFKIMDKIYPEDVVLSSVTSSLSISEIAQFMNKPDRMVGLHFFNPVHVMNLVEIIPGKNTSDETLKKAKIFIDNIGKTPLITPDTPGFIVNRILFAMINEAIGLLEEGNVSARDIDVAMKLGANHPIGPLSLADLIGLDNCLIILENLHKKTKNPEYSPHSLLIQKVKENNLGRKTRQGFFSYSK